MTQNVAVISGTLVCQSTRPGGAAAVAVVVVTRSSWVVGRASVEARRGQTLRAAS